MARTAWPALAAAMRATRRAFSKRRDNARGGAPWSKPRQGWMPTRWSRPLRTHRARAQPGAYPARPPSLPPTRARGPRAHC
eukprot:9210093-Lingulodinium_polyedra.AAC.1